MQTIQTPQNPTESPIGRATPRVDGPLKVCGLAKYTSDFNFPGQLYAMPVGATIANGRIMELDTRGSRKDARSARYSSSPEYRENLPFDLGAGFCRHLH